MTSGWVFAWKVGRFVSMACSFFGSSECISYHCVDVMGAELLCQHASYCSTNAIPNFTHVAWCSVAWIITTAAIWDDADSTGLSIFILSKRSTLTELGSSCSVVPSWETCWTEVGPRDIVVLMSFGIHEVGSLLWRQNQSPNSSSFYISGLVPASVDSPKAAASF